MKKYIAVITLASFMAGCSTSTFVKLPEDSILKIMRDSQTQYSEGRIDRTPLSWSSAGGIPYQIEKDGEVIQEGKMRAKFRPASIFWPPVALAYWPIGFRQNCYDFTNGTSAECSTATLNELKAESKGK